MGKHGKIRCWENKTYMYICKTKICLHGAQSTEGMPLKIIKKNRGFFGWIKI